jgi:excisionase family DNA binding protein
MTSERSERAQCPSEPVRYFTYTQVERLYGISRTTTWRAIRDGHLEAARVGRSVRISRESLERFMRERTAANR